MRNLTAIYNCTYGKSTVALYRCKNKNIASKRLSRHPTTWRSRIQKKIAVERFFNFQFSCLAPKETRPATAVEQILLPFSKGFEHLENKLNIAKNFQIPLPSPFLFSCCAAIGFLFYLNQN